jgi:hypothetical protein
MGRKCSMHGAREMRFGDLGVDRRIDNIEIDHRKMY